MVKVKKIYFEILFFCYLLLMWEWFIQLAVILHIGAFGN